MTPKKPRQYKSKTAKGSKKFKGFQKPPEYKSWYNTSDWKRYCYRFLHHNPKCYACGGEAREVDHAVAHKGDEKLFWCETNYLPLCKSCHSYCTAKYDRSSPPKTQEKSDWLVKIREQRGVSVRVKVVLFKKGSGLNTSQ